MDYRKLLVAFVAFTMVAAAWAEEEIILAPPAAPVFVETPVVWQSPNCKGNGVSCLVGDLELFNNAPTADYNTAIAEEPTIRLDGSAGAILLGAGDTTAPDVSISRTAANQLGLAAGDSFFVNTGSIVFEGATADAFEMTLAAADVTADITLTLPLSGGASAAVMVSSLTTNSVDVANSVWGASNALVFEGVTADAFELSLAPADVGADRTVTIPDMGAASALVASTLTTNTAEAANSVWGASNALVFEGATADTAELSLSPADVAADRTVTIPDMGAASALLATTLTTNTVDAANSVWGASNGIVFEGTTADGFEMTIASADVGADGTLTFTSDGQVAGEQLQTNGTGTLTWEAAASLREFKNINGLASAEDALRLVLGVDVYRFHYKRPEEVDYPVSNTGDYLTEYVGVMADEAPWAMHHNGRIVNPINTFGYTVLAIQAQQSVIDSQGRQIADLEARLAALEAILLQR